MAGSPTFKKRQKERARQEKQAEKKQRLAERKQQKDTSRPAGSGDPVVTYDENGEPQGLGFHDFS